MNFENIREWLERRLAHTDDAEAAAGGGTIEQLRQDAEARTVTPASLANVPSDLGRVVRYIREQRGWTCREIADRADIDESEVVNIETVPGFDPPPRTLVRLAEVCEFSTRRFQELANHVKILGPRWSATARLRFAAQSKNVGEVSRDEFEAVRALVETLSERSAERP